MLEMQSLSLCRMQMSIYIGTLVSSSLYKLNQFLLSELYMYTRCIGISCKFCRIEVITPANYFTEAGEDWCGAAKTTDHFGWGMQWRLWDPDRSIWWLLCLLRPLDGSKGHGRGWTWTNRSYYCHRSAKQIDVGYVTAGAWTERSLAGPRGWRGEGRVGIGGEGKWHRLCYSICIVCLILTCKPYKVWDCLNECHWWAVKALLSMPGTIY